MGENKDAHDEEDAPINYNSWTKVGLLKRIQELEQELQTRPAAVVQPSASQRVEAGEASTEPPQKKAKIKRKLDPTHYTTRFIALKLAYLGKRYGGYEYQATTNVTTIEEELWKALVKACLIFPREEHIVDFDCCEYSKCGRTDRGVSAFGQVIGIRVRSSRPLPKKPAEPSDRAAPADAAPGEEQPEPVPEKPWDPVRDELPYARMLNRLLPEDIRILAWCPTPPPDFSARFSCRERQYRYFFTQPAFAPSPARLEPGAAIKPGWLDIEAMRDAAKRLEGEHDFRNLCKVDPAKLITNWKRVIFEADIEEVRDVTTAFPYLRSADFAPEEFRDGKQAPKVYSFNVRGSAFLWHQIRHMISIIFLVGQRLEAPSVIDELLDPERTPGRPNYAMADEVPLVLWDCIFPKEEDPERKDAMDWIYVGEGQPGQKFGHFSLLDGLWETWRGRKMDELLAGQLLRLVSEQGTISEEDKTNTGNGSIRLFEGGNGGRLGGRYVSLMKRNMLQSPDVQNEKYAKRKGFASVEAMRASFGPRVTKAEGGEAGE